MNVTQIHDDLRREQLSRRLGLILAEDKTQPNTSLAALQFLRAGQLNSVGNWMQAEVVKQTTALETALVEIVAAGKMPPQLFVTAEKLITGAFAEINVDVSKNFAGLIQAIHDRNVRALKEHHAVEAKSDVVSADVLSRPVMGLLLNEHWDKIASDTLLRFKAAIRAGIEAGNTTKQLAQRISGDGQHFDIAARGWVKAHDLSVSVFRIFGADLATSAAIEAAKKRLLVQVRLMDSTESSINKIIQAAITAFSNATDEESADVDTEKNLGWQWLAVQDANVCPQCEFYDGSKWDAEGNPLEDGPEDPGNPPLHYNCRCSKVPIDLDAKEVDQNMNFDDYLSQFSRNEQETAFGKETLRAYQRGDITAAGLMGQKDAMLTLEQFKDL